MAEAFDQLLLPERKLNWRTLGTSFVGQSLLVLFLVEAGLLHPERLVIATQHLTYTPLVEKTARPQRPEPRAFAPGHHNCFHGVLLSFVSGGGIRGAD